MLPLNRPPSLWLSERNKRSFTIFVSQNLPTFVGLQVGVNPTELSEFYSKVSWAQLRRLTLALSRQGTHCAMAWLIHWFLRRAPDGLSPFVNPLCFFHPFSYLKHPRKREKVEWPHRIPFVWQRWCHLFEGPTFPDNCIISPKLPASFSFAFVPVYKALIANFYL